MMHDSADAIPLFFRHHVVRVATAPKTWLLSCGRHATEAWFRASSPLPRDRKVDDEIA